MALAIRTSIGVVEWEAAGPSAVYTALEILTSEDQVEPAEDPWAHIWEDAADG